MNEELGGAVKTAAKNLFGEDVEVELTRPDEQFGDYATNVALQLGQKLGKPPRQVAEALAAKLKDQPGLARAEVAGPGFINFRLSDAVLATELGKIDQNYGQNQTWAGQTVVAEYSDPNPFKVLHVGHLYTSVVGDAIANLLGAAGAKVHRVNFGGDVGLHVAKTMWGVVKNLGDENPAKLEQVSETEHADWLSERYVEGNAAYENDEAAKAQIIELNKRIYKLTETQDKDSPLAKIYWTTRQWSYDYFDEFYKRIGSHFDKYYPESEVTELGLKTVKEQLAGGVFKESDGAVIFDGEVHNLHTRVFINSQGLPTYETKDVGLIMAKWRDYKFDKSVIITANEIYEYMQVVLKAVEHFAPELAAATIHLTHGMVKLAGGQKMSSRRGNILRAVDVLEFTQKANQKLNKQGDEAVSLGAVKYAFLKQRLGGDIIYNPAESVSLEGNSGPYLQYAHARARSILAKAQNSNKQQATSNKLESGERSLALKISEYPEVVAKATNELLPSHIATYLYELAQNFSRFYEANRVLGDPRQAIRLKLVKAYAEVLKNGLGLLNIAAPDKI